MPRYIIHVGPHKTGSTYIQRGLDSNVQAFKARGIFVPTHWRSSKENPSHEMLFKYIHHERYDVLEREFRSWKDAGFHTVVLSQENLAVMSLAALCRLKELLGDNPVEVAYYTRRSADWLWSAYHESVMHGSCATFLEFVLPHLMSPPKSDFLNRENEIARLIRVFGARNLRIFSFTNIVEAGHDLFEHFCSTLIPDEPITRVPGGKANPSFAPEMLELLRAMHSLDRRRGQPLNLHLTQAYRRRSKEFDLTSLLATLTQYRKSVDLLPALKELRDVNLSLRRRLAPSIVSPMPEDGLAPEGPTVITYIARDYLLLPGMAEMIQRIRNAL